MSEPEIEDFISLDDKVRDIQHSHWSSSYIAALSLVESSRVVKYFHALKGPIIDALSVATLGCTHSIALHFRTFKKKAPV